MNKKKPIFLLLPGPSLVNIEKRMETLKAIPATWITLNRFPILERKLHVEFDMIYCSSPVRIIELKEDIIRFASQPDKFLITNTDIMRTLPRIANEAGHVVVTDLGYEPGVWYSSLTALLLWIFREEFKSVFLLGADGGIIDPKKNCENCSEGFEGFCEYGGEISGGGGEGCYAFLRSVYYGQEQINPEKENFSARRVSIPKDTSLMNTSFWRLVNRLDLPNKTKVFNVTNKSLINCFDKMSWEDFDAVVNATSKISI